MDLSTIKKKIELGVCALQSVFFTVIIIGLFGTLVDQDGYGVPEGHATDVSKCFHVQQFGPRCVLHGSVHEK